MHLKKSPNPSSRAITWSTSSSWNSSFKPSCSINKFSPFTDFFTTLKAFTSSSITWKKELCTQSWKKKKNFNTTMQPEKSRKSQKESFTCIKTVSLIETLNPKTLSCPMGHANCAILAGQRSATNEEKLTVALSIMLHLKYSKELSTTWALIYGVWVY